MKAARTWWRSHHAAELAAIIGCDVRSAERYLAGHRTADAEAVLALLTSEHGAKLIEAATAGMPADRQAAFWTEMGKAAKRADILARQAALQRELETVT